MSQQTSIDLLEKELIRRGVIRMGFIIPDDLYKQANVNHKQDCINFAEQWEARCNEGNMDSKEQLYNEIFKTK
ncbi:MAG: hypothetical protein ACOVNU_09935 [Candidatus Kapaibacteriota bacterium]